MFIEKLTEEDYQDFANTQGFDDIEYIQGVLINNQKTGKVSVGMNLEFYNGLFLKVSDFNCKVENPGPYPEKNFKKITKQWNAFMYTKFGEIYRSAYKSALRNNGRMLGNNSQDF